MKTQLTLIVAVSLLLSLTTISVHAISEQQIEKKAREIAEFKKKQELLSIARNWEQIPKKSLSNWNNGARFSS